ncbi:MAG: S8 family serine peptidase, partial [Actinobacteria bacterium]|nr:S8 family serine peptidase [Actinomycetota bacterium]
MRRLTLLLAALVGVFALAPEAHASNDSYFNEQWNLARANVPDAWGTSTGAIRVGVVDTGIDAGHPDISGHVVASAGCQNASGGNASECTGSADDVVGHGTHVGGIIAATKDNGEGVAGVAPSAQLVFARVFDDSGSTDYPEVLAGARWAIDHGAKVINFSLGDGGLYGTGLLITNSQMKDVANQVWGAGVIPVVAAGNGQPTCGEWSNTNAVVVTATGFNDERADDACAPTNARWGVAAPGGNSHGGCDVGAGQNPCVLSTYARSKTPPGNAPYAYLEGTSMAAPAVTGAIADLLAKGMSNIDAINKLLATVDPVGCGSGCKGRIN